MATYKICVSFIDAVEKKLNRIAKKCQAFGNDFHYEIVGEEFIITPAIKYPYKSIVQFIGFQFRMIEV